MGQRAAFDALHVQSLPSDQFNDLRQLAGLVIHREQQRHALPGLRRGGRVPLFHHQKPGSVVPVLVDALRQNFQPVQLRRFGAGDGCHALIPQLRHMAGRIGGVAPHHGLRTVGTQKQAALGQRLLVAHHRFDVRQRGPRQSQQVLPDGQVAHAGDGQLRMGVQKVQHGGHVPGVGVLKGQHTELGLAPADRLAYLRPGGKRLAAGKGEQPPQRNVAPRALHPLIGRGVPPQHGPLVRLGHLHGLLQKFPVIGAQFFLLQPGGVVVQHHLLPRRVKDRFAGLRLVQRHLRHRLHALLKQRGHLRVDGVDFLSRLL